MVKIGNHEARKNILRTVGNYPANIIPDILREVGNSKNIYTFYFMLKNPPAEDFGSGWLGGGEGVQLVG